MDLERGVFIFPAAAIISRVRFLLPTQSLTFLFDLQGSPTVFGHTGSTQEGDEYKQYKNDDDQQHCVFQIKKTFFSSLESPPSPNLTYTL
jgi:hypothetical protein